ncbi:hypothetical protein SEA_CULVER_159 [Gordonia phage Culver]|nr:hypothetical protein SEA_CULVER_159 [Gordonia phage Culver]
MLNRDEKATANLAIEDIEELIRKVETLEIFRSSPGTQTLMLYYLRPVRTKLESLIDGDLVGRSDS